MYFIKFMIITDIVKVKMTVHHQEFTPVKFPCYCTDIAKPHAGIQQQAPIAAENTILVRFLPLSSHICCNTLLELRLSTSSYPSCRVRYYKV